MVSFSKVIAAWSIVLGSAAFAQQTTENNLNKATDAEYIVPVAANEIKIMNYNVENLFDADHDAN
jgi:hypothetical protein